MKKELLVPLASGILSICLSLTACGGSPNGAATPSPSPSAVPTEESTPTPKLTAPPTPIPTETPSLLVETPALDEEPTTSEELSFSVGNVATLIEVGSDDRWDYIDVTYDETSITVNWSIDDIADIIRYGASGEEEFEEIKDEWFKIKNAVIEIAKVDKKFAIEMKQGDIQVIHRFLDSDHETPLLTVTDGEVTYNILADLEAST